MILPAFYAVYLAALDAVVPPHVARVLVVAVGGVCICIGGRPRLERAT